MDSEKQQHLEYQRQYFDANCNFFRQAVPDEIQERTRRIAASAELNEESLVLDVGTGMGALIKHFCELGVKPANVLGCDLSERMLDEARVRYPEARFWQGDALQLDVPPSSYNAVFFNACFGNIIDQQNAIAWAARALMPDGILIISHPLGNQFVAQLQQSDPQLVLTLMPSREQLLAWIKDQPLKLVELEDTPDFYLAKLRKT